MTVMWYNAPRRYACSLIDGKWDMAFWQYILDNQQKYIGLVLRHIELTLIALCISIFLGTAIAVACYRNDRAVDIANTVVSAFRVIPSIALLLLCMPIMGTGFLPALFALTILGLSPVVNNGITSLRGLDPAVLEAANACGMEDRQLFWKVRWPLAMPGIITGYRMAGLSISAGATLAAYIGAGGLGELILSGISQFRYDMIFAGALTMILLSLLVEILFQLIYLRVSRFRLARG